MTNREVLNKLPSDKLAKILDNIDCGQCAYNDIPPEETANICMSHSNCVEGIRLWLEAEAKPLMTGMLEEPVISEREHQQYEVLRNEVKALMEEETE